MNENIINIIKKLGKEKIEDDFTSKEYLTKLLKSYEHVLSKPMIEYLRSLIELEFSVVREYISESDRNILSETLIYKRVMIYNIIRRAKMIFEKMTDCLLDLQPRIPIHSLDARDSKNGINLFSFKADTEEYETPGVITLYQSLENKEIREAELDRTKLILNRLYEERNPYFSSVAIIGGCDSDWAFAHAKRIQEYENKLTQLESKDELDDEAKRQIELTKLVTDAFLEDYGLSSESFQEERKPFSYGKSVLNRTLVKKQSNLTIEKKTTIV